jgi:hypothetical protein
MSWWPAASRGCHSSAQASSDSSAPWVSTSGLPAPATIACNRAPSPVATWWLSPSGRLLPVGSSEDSPGEAVDTVGPPDRCRGTTISRCGGACAAGYQGSGRRRCRGSVRGDRRPGGSSSGWARRRSRGRGQNRQSERAASAFGTDRAVAGPKGRRGRACGSRRRIGRRLVQGTVGKPQGPGKRLPDRFGPWGHPPMELGAALGLGSPTHGHPFTCGSPRLDNRSEDAILSLDANLA